jgi:Domain of unknown function (DUF4440)
LAAEVTRVDPKAPVAGTGPRSPEETAVRAAVTAWRDAKVKRDVPSLDRLMTSDFVEINQNGDRLSRAPLLSLYKGGDLVFAGIDIEELSVEILGKRARVTGVHTENVKYRGRDVGGRIAFTEVYVNSGGRWQIEWSQLRPLPKSSHASLRRSVLGLSARRPLGPHHQARMG